MLDIVKQFKHNIHIRRFVDASLILCWSMYLISTIDFDFVSTHNAWTGYSFAEIINIFNDYQHFDHDYVAQAIVPAFSNSQYFVLASWISRSFGINSLLMQQGLICLEIVALSTAGYVLPLIRKSRYGILEGSLCMIILSASQSLDYNWGRWPLLYIGQTYIFPYCAWIFSLILIRCGKPWISGVVLLLATVIHPVVGLLGALSSLFFQSTNYIALNPSLGKHNSLKRFFLSTKTFAPVFSFSTVLLVTNASRGLSLVSDNDFVRWTKSTNYHWYPWTEGLFADTTDYIYPYVSIIIGAGLIDLIYNNLVNAADQRQMRLWPSITLITFLSLLGVLASEISLSPTIIKLAVFRISAFALIIVTPLYVEAFIHPIISPLKTSFLSFRCSLDHIQSVLRFLLVLSSLLYFISALSGAYLWPGLLYASIISMLILLYSVVRGLFPGLLFSLVSAFVMAVTISATSRNVAIIGKLLTLNNFYLFLLASFVSLVICCIPQYLSNSFGIRYRDTVDAVAILSVSAWIFILPNSIISRWHSVMQPQIALESRRVMDAYHKIQLCAKSSLDKNSIIMPPLDRSYGWRSGSGLMSTGSARDWAISWIYTSDLKVFLEGKRRLEVLGMHKWLKFNHDDNMFNGIREFDTNLDELLDSLDPVELMSMAEKLGATHYVIDLSRALSRSKAITQVPVCTNDYYALLPVTPSPNRPVRSR